MYKRQVYGIGAFSLSKDIGVSRREAEDYIHDYLRNYKGVADYMERVVEEAKKNGYVETLFGRRRDVYKRQSLYSERPSSARRLIRR